MSQPTPEPIPPAYLAHRVLLVTVLVLVTLVAGSQLVPVAGDIVGFVGSLIRSVHQTWADIDWEYL